jgi:hypothetical protein
MRKYGSAELVGVNVRFNIRTHELCTDAGELVKILHCPLRQQWNKLDVAKNSPHRTCSNCERTVLDTSQMADEELLAIIRSDPNTCLAISSKQKNVTFTT